MEKPAKGKREAKEMSMELKPEEYFLRYAYPCITNLVQKKTICRQDADNLDQLLFDRKKSKGIKREYLESCFPEAFRRIKELAKELGKDDYWDVSIIRKYWLDDNQGHNHFIDLGDGEYGKATPAFKELCKVHLAEVVSKKDNILTVKYDHTQRNVFATLVPYAKPGDKVSVHLAYAIEKME
jgi:hypothetical protein